MFKGFVLSTLVNVLILGSSLLIITFIKVHLYAKFSFDWTPLIIKLNKKKVSKHVGRVKKFFILLWQWRSS